MRNKQFLIFIVSFSCILKLSSQPFISNDSIKFSILRKSTAEKGHNKIYPVKHSILVFLSENQLNECKELSNEKWIDYLNDEKKDWAANLILYNLYMRDAIYFLGSKDINFWKLKKKKSDIRFWKKFLKNHRPATSEGVAVNK
jgi:hypothetical protein